MPVVYMSKVTSSSQNLVLYDSQQEGIFKRKPGGRRPLQEEHFEEFVNVKMSETSSDRCEDLEECPTINDYEESGIDPQSNETLKTGKFCD